VGETDCAVGVGVLTLEEGAGLEVVVQPATRIAAMATNINDNHLESIISLADVAALFNKN
jgi:hypothetical protein